MQGKNKVLKIEDNNRVYAFASLRAVAFRAGMYTTCPGRRGRAAANGPKLLQRILYWSTNIEKIFLLFSHT